MTIIKAGANKTLEGHKLLFVTPWVPAEEFLGRLHSEFSGLQIAHYELPRGRPAAEARIPNEVWKEATILVTGGYSLPDKQLVPNLVYVQVQSAGANRILEHPLFLETDVTFSTANGVHG